MGEKFISFIKSMFSVGDQLRYSLDFLLLLYCLQPATGFDFGASSSKGLFPSIFNLGTHAEVRANTSCGSGRQEQYCTLGDSKDTRCGICDEKDPDRAHPAHFILDGTERWWQSPSLAFGPAYHTVTLTINLKQIYQVDYLILTAGQSPRPANWVLERSLDGVNWEAWQYHAMSDQDCWLDYGIEPRKGKPVYKADDEVICTSYYSSLKPIENGEISISLVNGRPGAKGPSKTLLDFTKARYIRLRFQKLHILAIDKTILGDIAHPEYADIARRYFYSIKDVSIGGQCPCHGHASECPVLQDTGDYECRCRHNTCGALCDSCCPMFNQRRWRPGKYISGNECERCQCFGHADECYFDPLVEAERGSLNTAGKKSGGGICLDCRDKTTGVNCERCVDGYYRPNGVSRFDPKPCVPCSCSTPGSQGVSKCYADSELSHQGHEAGDCLCKPGFTGPRCDECSVGYTNYPECTPCPCSLAGTHGEQCTGNCKCKKHATGRRCDRCKPGFFALQSANPEGCTECFCYGVTSSCDSADYGVEIIDHQSGWMVTDLSGSLQIPPYWSSVTSGLTIAQEDIGLDAYYWQAPDKYLGNKLLSYGQKLTVHTSWHTGRGDTSGTPTNEPDVILEGAGFRMGYGRSNYRGSKNATIKLVFLEHDWYFFPDGGPVSKHEFMRCLGDLEHLLIRAKYHSDQLEGTLHTAAMQFGAQASLSLTRTKAVERCSCPQGYEGLSCQECSYGYTRVNNTIYKGECRKCNCYGHSSTCDPFTLECATCEHNTVGDKCQDCAKGFYGNAKLGRPNDCKPCKCPLEIPSNNFSPVCQVATLDYDKYSVAPDEYKCTACPQGYEGAHCERCSNGYYGNPLTIGDYCKPCRCNGNADQSSSRICDHITGECLSCLGNTGGWSCDVCVPGYYGNPGDGFCKPCACNIYGASSSVCDPRSGECPCKDKYVGRTCGQCNDGFGNIRAGCRRCECNNIGATGDGCDADTGKCFCKPGVTGFTCDKCLPLFYGFSSSGCRDCGCHPQGSISPNCDMKTGKCECRSKVKGKQCDSCESKHWGITSENGCTKCECDMYGSVHNDCDDVTGQCVCKPGVGGPRCSACLVGYWGISPAGCKKCSPCQKPGHVCDPDTGRCVCPALTEGERCERCKQGTWNYHPNKGCTRCKCHQEGSVYGQCDQITGKCRCLEGFEGDNCDRCAAGFYRFPNCRACNCIVPGTDPEACSSGVCQCDESGVCPCKSTVVGKKCASCAPGFFGLSALNPEGCTQCFCFGRSSQCTQAQYSWTQLVMPRRRHLRISRGESDLDVEDGLLVVPGDDKDVVVGVNHLFKVPLYWRLPEMFRGDKVASYNGFFRFNVQTNGEKIFSGEILENYPLVFLRGNHNIKLRHFPSRISGSGRYEVHLHESEWINQNNPEVPVTRAMLMIALQGIQDVLIRGTDAFDSTVSTLHGVSLDTARPATLGSPRPALGVEMCTCPPKYNSTSCQDPGKGFYRYYKESYVESEIIIDLLGDSKPCDCNGRTDTCDPATGACINCRDNTAGALCDICAAGFYGDPVHGEPCTPCQCPSSDRNFALTCSTAASGAFSCQCQEGYTGPSCDRCEYGYYGNPEKAGGKCSPCDCNPYGSETDQCDSNTGLCYCVPGVKGRDCSQCEPRHLLTSLRKCKNCNDACVGTLLDMMESIRYTLDVAHIDDIDPAPLKKLSSIRTRTEYLENELRTVGSNYANVSLLYSQENIVRPQAELSELEVDKLSKISSDQLEKTRLILEYGSRVGNTIQTLEKDIMDLVIYLDNHGRERTSAVSLSRALAQASDILAGIKEIDFTETDIRARTELSEARILYDKVQLLIFGKIELSSIQEKVDTVDSLVSDLLQYINQGMSSVNQATQWNQNNQNKIKEVDSKCRATAELKSNSSQALTNGRQLVEEGRTILDSSMKHYNELTNIQGRFLNREKALEEREIGLSRVVEDYRTRFNLPCQANAEKLFAFAQRLERMFDKRVGVNADQALQAANSYKKIIDALQDARIAAREALEASITTFKEVDPPGRMNLRFRTEKARLRSEDLRQEAHGLGKNADDMGIQINSLKLELEKNKFDLEQTGQLVADIGQELKQHDYVSRYAKDVKESAARSLQESISANNKTDEMINKIRLELGAKAKELQSFSAEELGAIPWKLGESQRILQKVEKQAVYMDRRGKDLLKLNQDVGTQLKLLRSRIAMARHAASNVHISITSDESTGGECLRSYDVGLTPSTHNEISIIYGIETEDRDALLAFLPTGKRTEQGGFNFIALEMIDRRIRFVWNLGSGTQSITHNVVIESAVRLDRQDTLWYKITAERIGNIGRLNVRKIRPKYDLPEYHQWVVGESPASSNILAVHETDKLWVGGAPNYYKTADLKSGGKFNGVIYQLMVNKNRIGLWDFSSNFGCKETYPGVTDIVNQHSCHSFSGSGYATQDQIRNYDPRYYAISLEFKTFDENALLLMVVNHENQQNMLIQLQEGMVKFIIDYGDNVKLEFSTKNTYNSGQWVKIEAGRAYRKGLETGVLRVTHSGVREDLMDTLPSLKVRELEMGGSKLYFGGVPPDFPYNKFPNMVTRALLGNMRGITTSNPGSNSLMNPLYTEQGRMNPYYGVDPYCEHKILKSVLCRGQGHIEVKSQPLRRNSSFGFTFKTKQGNGVILLSTFLGQPSGSIADFYSISLVDGRIHLAFGNSAADITRFTTDGIYSDGFSHSLFVNKQANKVSVYVDDARVDRGEILLDPSAVNIKAPAMGGLFLGGVPSIISDQVLSLNMLPTSDNFVGVIRDFAFIDEVSVRIVAMNEPVSFFNVAIGRGA